MRLRSLVFSVALALPLAASESVIRFQSLGPASPAVFNAGTHSATVATADFNNDGKIDAAIASGSDSIAILIGKGDGTFNSPSTIKTAGTAANMVAAADMNHDSVADLIVADFTAGTVAVYLGKGDGTFNKQTPVPSGKSGASDLQIGDLNHDGDADVVVAEGVNVAVFMSDGHGALAPLPTIVPVSGATIANLRIADFDRDNKLDIVFTTNVDVYLMRGNGDGTFKTAQKIFSASSGASQSLVFVAAGDLNRDGAPDIVVRDEVDSSIVVLINRGDGTFQAPAKTADAASGTAKPDLGDIVVADFNGDTIPDVALVQPDLVAIYRGKGNGTFTSSSAAATPATSPQRAAVADFDHDGRPDLALAYLTGRVGVMRNISGLSETLIDADSVNTTASQPIQITATVKQHFLDNAFHSTGDFPDGNVTFRDGATVISTKPLVNGVASTAFQSSTIGDHNITAVYTGESGEWDPSTSSVLVVHVSAAPPAATTTLLNISNASIPFGTASVNLTATVTSTTTPTGSVRFTADAATNDVPLAAGTASLALNTSAMTAGPHTLTAAYLGDATHAASTSAPQTLTVTKAAIAMTLTVTADSGAYRIAVGGNFAQATGTLTLTIDGAAVDTQPADGNREFVRDLALGTHTISVSYSGDANHETSITAPYTLTITPAQPRRRAARH